MQQIINVYEAKTNLSKLLEGVSRGDEFIIAKSGKPVAKLTSYKTKKQIKFGVLKGKIQIIDDDSFDDPLPSDVLASFGYDEEK